MRLNLEENEPAILYLGGSYVGIDKKSIHLGGRKVSGWYTCPGVVLKKVSYENVGSAG
jgi:hypothetical protein